MSDPSVNLTLSLVQMTVEEGATKDEIISSLGSPIVRLQVLVLKMKHGFMIEFQQIYKEKVKVVLLVWKLVFVVLETQLVVVLV